MENLTIKILDIFNNFVYHQIYMQFYEKNVAGTGL